MVQLMLQTRGGSLIVHDWEENSGTPARRVDLGALAAKEGLTASDIEKIFLLVTNLDPQKSANYEIDSSI